MKNYLMMAFMAVLMFTGVASAADGELDTASIEAALNGLKVPLYALGAVVLGVRVIPALFRLIARILP